MRLIRKFKGITVLLVVLTMTLSFTTTAYAKTYEKNIFIDHYGKYSLSSDNPYISNTFTPQTNKIYYLFYMSGKDTEKYTIYVQRYNNGVWTNVYSYQNSAAGSISTGTYVIPERQYRVYIKYTGSALCTFSIDVWELIISE